MSTLAIIGAGPKAVAVVAKAKALADLGVSVPSITVIDPLGVGGHWSPEGGWTDGGHLLGTSPEKDIAFPYTTSLTGDPTLDRAIDARLYGWSWNAFLAATGRLAAWVDRGRINPPHKLWAEYLRWVATNVGLDPVRGCVTACELGDENGWQLTVGCDGEQESTVSADAVLITGPGPSNRTLADVEGLLSVAHWWKLIAEGTRITGTVAVIGGGETAASVVEELTRHPAEVIDIISPSPCPLSRGENKWENELYSDPTKWTVLDEKARRVVLERTDRGVFSQFVLDRIRYDERIRHVTGTVAAAESGSHGSDAVVLTVTNPAGGNRVLGYDIVIDARGSCPVWFMELLGPQAAEALCTVAASDDGQLSVPALEKSIGPDLSVEGFPVPLFLPSLAGFAQGPGFANLSCLGTLSDRILGGMGVVTGAGHTA